MFEFEQLLSLISLFYLSLKKNLIKLNKLLIKNKIEVLFITDHLEFNKEAVSRFG